MNFFLERISKKCFFDLKKQFSQCAGKIKKVTAITKIEKIKLTQKIVKSAYSKF